MQRVDLDDNIVWRTSLGGGGIVSLALQPASGFVPLCPGAAPPRHSALTQPYNTRKSLNCRDDSPFELCERRDGSDQMVAAGSMDGSVSLLNAVSGELLCSRRVHRKYVVSLAWASDSYTFVSASWDHSFAVHRAHPSSSAEAGAC